MPDKIDEQLRQWAAAQAKIVGEKKKIVKKNPVPVQARPPVIQWQPAPEMFKARKLGVVRADEPPDPKKKDVHVDFLNLDAVLEKPKNRVELIGVELEGGWVNAVPGMPVQRDGSVFKDRDEGGLQRSGYPGYQCGEIGLGPIPVGIMPAQMRLAWPQAIDKSCGMHVHMSFHTLFQYVVLADSPVYQATMMEYLRRWAKEEGFPEKDPIWPRLNGKSEYCQPKFWPMAQMEYNKKDHDKERFGHRYTAIHYCWERYKTVECRLLPMMATPEQGIRAVRKVVDITNAYLLLAEKKKVREHGRVERVAKKVGDVREERGKDSLRVVFDNGDIYEESVEIKL